MSLQSSTLFLLCNGIGVVFLIVYLGYIIPWPFSSEKIFDWHVLRRHFLMFLVLIKILRSFN